MAHRFDPEQKIDSQGHLEEAKGPVDDGEEMFWISAFIYQNKPGHYAAAWGDAEWANGKKNKWSCRTTMAPGSQPFEEGTAQAWALARVSDDGGKFFPWHDEVKLV